MSSIKEATNVDLSGYEPVPRMERPAAPPISDLQPVLNPFLRCPMPPTSVSPDSLRQFYSGGNIPQMRVLTPPTATSGVGSGTSTIITKVIQASTSPSAVAPVTSSGVLAVHVSLTSPVLNPNDSYQGTIPISKSFQLLNVSANGACRIEIYGTAIAQASDLGRGLDIAPLPGTQQNLITDLVLDDTPYQWSFQNRIGNNADNPQLSVIYVTVTNLGLSSLALVLTLMYASLES